MPRLPPRRLQQHKGAVLDSSLTQFYQGVTAGGTEFYDLHITPWLQLTGDLQIIRPNRPDAGTAYVPGGRLRIVF